MKTQTKKKKTIKRKYFIKQNWFYTMPLDFLQNTQTVWSYSAQDLSVCHILGLQNTHGRLSLPVSFLSKWDCMSNANEFSNYLNRHLLGPAVKCLADSLLYQLAALPRWSYNCCFIINRFLLRRKERSFKKQYKQAGHLRIWEKAASKEEGSNLD